MENITISQCAETTKNKFYRVIFDREGVVYTTDGWMDYEQATKIKVWLSKQNVELSKIKTEIAKRGHWISIDRYAMSKKSNR